MPPKAARLSSAMLAMLRNASRGESLFAGLIGRSAHGGAGWTVMALKRRELLSASGAITDAGRAVVAAEAARKDRQIKHAASDALSAIQK